MALQPSTWRGSSEQIPLHQVGCEARTSPAEGDVFFLDFYLYRTNQMGALADQNPNFKSNEDGCGKVKTHMRLMIA